ncbi:MAG: TMEM175 family protein [Candidatus Nanopelagicales bacterium]
MTAQQQTERPPADSEYPPGRIVAFSDGVVAIAITLLILPLVGITIPANEGSNPLGFLWRENSGLITSFLISWAVIMTFWLVHHRVFGIARAINSNMIRWNILWLFAIVVFPFPTSLLSQSNIGAHGEQQVAAFYIGTMFVISGSLSMITQQLRVHPELREPDAPFSPSAAIRGPLMSGYLGALFLVSLFTGYALYGLIGLGLVQPATAIIFKLRRASPSAQV